MPNLIDLRRRIRSVKNTQQITSAMKMVAAAKLRRAQDKVIAARPYSSLLQEMLSSVLHHLPEGSPVLEHPLLARREPNRIALAADFQGKDGKAADADGPALGKRRANKHMPLAGAHDIGEKHDVLGFAGDLALQP